MPTVPINGLDLHYQTAGAGSPLLLIAGFASDSESWAPVVPILSKHYRLIMPDNRAVGRTEPKDAEITLQHMCDDCIALMDALELERFAVLGHSMGGLVAMHIAARWPNRVERLVLAASAPLHSAHTASVVDTLVTLREAGTPDALWFKTLFHWLMAPQFFANPAMVDAAVTAARNYPHRQTTEAMRRQADAIARFETGIATPPIEIPTLAILGERDLLLPTKDATGALKAIGDIHIEELPDTAHSLHWDDPQAFCDKVIGFLKPH